MLSLKVNKFEKKKKQHLLFQLLPDQYDVSVTRTCYYFLLLGLFLYHNNPFFI